MMRRAVIYKYLVFFFVNKHCAAPLQRGADHVILILVGHMTYCAAPLQRGAAHMTLILVGL